MINKKEKTLVLIDSHALLHRAYHALPPLNTQKGELVNAVFGFTAILLRVLKELRPDYLAAAFDLAAPTFRHQEFEDYQATRVKAPGELYAQIGRTKEILAAFGAPVYEKEGFEADDVLGTIVAQVQKQDPGLQVFIVTGDLDTLQLVGGNIKIFTLKKGIKDTIIYDEKAVRERYNLAPSQMNDFKGLKGDSSDNIPGIAGVGEKTAAELLQEFGSLEELYNFLEGRRPKFKTGNEKTKNKLKSLGPKLLAAKEQAFFSKYLATIKKDVPLKFNLAEAAMADFDRERVKKIFKELGFYSLLDRLADKKNSEAPTSPKVERGGPVADSREAEIYEKIEEVRKAGVLSPQIYEVEKKLVPLIRSMETTGVRVDVGRLEFLDREVGRRLEALEGKIYQLAGARFNINSPQQLSEVLFQRLKLAVKGLKKTPGKVISTAAPELVKLQGRHQIIDAVLEYRELAKLKTTYIDALPRLLAADGRLHTTFDQLGTATGRLSSKNPNLQNIPVKTELGREIRRAFVAAPGCKLLAADYSQIELRVVASLAQDRKMINALKAGEDIHILTAHEVFDVRPEEVSERMRQAAKTLNFGVIYGMSVHGFAQASGLSVEKAKVFIEKYFDEFYGVAQYVERTKEEAAKNGYVQTLFGRKRFIPEINSSAWNLRQAAERMAINMPVQGGAADLIKMAMVEIAKSLELIANSKSHQLYAISPKLLLQVHDELVFEVPEQELKTAAKEIKNIMENVYQLTVPLKVEIKVGDNWGEMEKLSF